MRTTARSLALLLAAVVLFHGCGSFDPVAAPELRIFDLRLTQVARGVRLDWRTTEAASSRIDYGPTQSVTTTFFEWNRNGIGLDCDGHIISELRTNCEVVGPQVNSVVDYTPRTEHSLTATEMTIGTTHSIAVSSINPRGQRAVLTLFARGDSSVPPELVTTPTVP